MYSHTHKNRKNKSSSQAASKSNPFDLQPFVIQQKPENTIAQPVTKKELYSQLIQRQKIERKESYNKYLQQKKESSSRAGKNISFRTPEPWIKEPIQTKLTIGKVNDKYEQEADKVARDVVQRINAPSRKDSSENQKENSVEQQQPIQKKENNTGLPDKSKTGMENIRESPVPLETHQKIQGNQKVLQCMRKDEIPGLKAVANNIKSKYPGYTIVGMGGSPAPVIAYLQSQGHAAYNIPLSIKGDKNRLSPKQQTELKKMIQASIPNFSNINKIVIIDVAASGKSIVNAVKMIESAYPNKDIKGFAITDNPKSLSAVYKKMAEDGHLSSLDNNVYNKYNQRDGFFDKLFTGGYKQYRPVGVFKPREGDEWDEYATDEKLDKYMVDVFLQKQENILTKIQVEKIKKLGYSMGSRHKYKDLVDYLSDETLHTDEGIGDTVYEADKNDKLNNYTISGHKKSEDNAANKRIAKIKQRERERVKKSLQSSEPKPEPKKKKGFKDFFSKSSQSSAPKSNNKKGFKDFFSKSSQLPGPKSNKKKGGFFSRLLGKNN